MSEFIRIQSTKTITVTPGLQYEDYTNYDSDIPNRLKVSASWPKASIQIREGVDLYPAVIREWDSVKALVNAGIFTIAESIEEPSEKKVEESNKLNAALEKIEEASKKAPSNKKKKKTTLEEAAE